MIYFIALIIFLLPSYLVRFSVFGVPTTLLEVLIYIAFVVTLIIQKSKLKFRRDPCGVQNYNLKVKTDNKKFSIFNFQFSFNSQLFKFSIPIILFTISGIISVIVAPDKREALGLFKAYIVDPIIFYWIIVSNFQFSIFPSTSSGPLWGNFQSTNKLSNFQTKSNKQNSQLNPYDLWLKTLIASGMVVAVHAIWQKLTGQVTVDGRVLGIFSLDSNASPNYLAFYLAPILTLAIGQLSNQLPVTSDKGKILNQVQIDNRENSNNGLDCHSGARNDTKSKFYPLLHATRPHRLNSALAGVACYMLLGLALWFTGSRAAIGAVIVGILSFFVMKYWQKIKVKKYLISLVILLLVTLSLIAWQFLKPNWQATSDAGRVSSSNNIRWEIWNTTVKDIIPHNLIWLKGVGLGNYQEYFTQLTKNRVNYPEWISPWAHTPHNIFLNIWVNLGLLGLVSFIWILILFFKFLIFNFQFSIKNNLTSYLLPLTTMLITIIIQGIVDSPVWKNDLVIIFWLILALVVVITKNQEPIIKD